MGAVRDYAQAALDRLEDANESGNPQMAALFAQQAQVYATLALVEEQRTANLIAAHTQDCVVGPEGPGFSGEQSRVERQRAFWMEYRQNITDRLGLS